MKKITLLIISITLASLVFVLSGCEMSLDLGGKKTPEDTQSHTAIIEVTDDKGVVIATESVTISKEEIKQGESFFNKENNSTTAPTGVSSDRLQQAVANKNNVTTTAQNGNSTDKKPGTSASTDGKKPTSSQNTEDLPYVQDDAAVLASTQYMITGRAVYEGEATPYKVARSGEKLSMFTMVNGQQLGVIVTEDMVYLLSVTEKTYIEVTKEMLKENMTDEEYANFTGSALDTNKKVVQTMNVSEDGSLYDVVVYADGVRDYFIGSTIMKTVSPDGSVLYYDSVSAVVPASVFAPPSDYKKTTLDEEGVSEFVGAIETTEHNHDHE